MRFKVQHLWYEDRRSVLGSWKVKKRKRPMPMSLKRSFWLKKLLVFKHKKRSQQYRFQLWIIENKIDCNLIIITNLSWITVCSIKIMNNFHFSLKKRKEKKLQEEHQEKTFFVHPFNTEKSLFLKKFMTMMNCLKIIECIRFLNSQIKLICLMIFIFFHCWRHFWFNWFNIPKELTFSFCLLTFNKNQSLISYFICY